MRPRMTTTTTTAPARRPVISRMVGVIVPASLIIFLLFWLGSVGITNGESTNRQLAVFVTVPSGASSSSDVDLSSVTNELSERIGNALGLNSVVFDSPTSDPSNNGITVLPFYLYHDGYLVVSTATATPGEYVTFSSRWKELLSTRSTVIFDPAITLTTGYDEFGNEQIGEVVIDPDQYEIDVTVVSSEADDDFEEGHLPNVDNTESSDSAVELEAITTALQSRYELLQLRLTDTDLTTLAAGPEVLTEFLAGLRSAAATILSIAADRIILFSLDSTTAGSLIAQFTAYPATDSELDSLSHIWSTAVAGTSHSALDDAFGVGSADVEYPATVLTGVTTSSTAATDTATIAEGINGDGDASNAPLVGALVGGVACVAIFGGAGYAVYRKKQSKGAGNQGGGLHGGSGTTHPSAFNNMAAEYSPGGLSPNGLTNVDIRGENNTPGGGVNR